MPQYIEMNEKEIEHLTDLVWDLGDIYEQMRETFPYDSLLILNQLQLGKQQMELKWDRKPRRNKSWDISQLDPNLSYSTWTWNKSAKISAILPNLHTCNRD